MRNSNKILLAVYAFFIALIFVFMIIIKIGVNREHEIKYRENPDSTISNTLKTAMVGYPDLFSGGQHG